MKRIEVLLLKAVKLGKKHNLSVSDIRSVVDQAWRQATERDHDDAERSDMNYNASGDYMGNVSSKYKFRPLSEFTEGQIAVLQFMQDDMNQWKIVGFDFDGYDYDGGKENGVQRYIEKAFA